MYPSSTVWVNPAIHQQNQHRNIIKNRRYICPESDVFGPNFNIAAHRAQWEADRRQELEERQQYDREHPAVPVSRLPLGGAIFRSPDSAVLAQPSDFVPITWRDPTYRIQQEAYAAQYQALPTPSVMSAQINQARDTSVASPRNPIPFVKYHEDPKLATVFRSSSETAIPTPTPAASQNQIPFSIPTTPTTPITAATLALPIPTTPIPSAPLPPNAPPFIPSHPFPSTPMLTSAPALPPHPHLSFLPQTTFPLQQTPWPSQPEFRYEGTDRKKTDPIHRRFLPIPRHPAPNDTVSWMARPERPAPALERPLFEAPQAVGIWLKEHWVDESEFWDAEGVEALGTGVWGAVFEGSEVERGERLGAGC